MKSLLPVSRRVARMAIALAVAALIVGAASIFAGAASAESGCHKNPPPKVDGIGLLARDD